MAKKGSKDKWVVYSTDPEFQGYDDRDDEIKSIPPSDQLLTISLDRKHRKGKTVTLVEGFLGTGLELKELEKQLKSRCGTGGSSRDGIIIIQGDFRTKISGFLSAEGFGTKLKG